MPESWDAGKLGCRKAGMLESYKAEVLTRWFVIVNVTCDIRIG
ncbi:hypothetical protein D1AOALGA4SA_754 [Olavius algarvensis Delta 1 endosymbiont]|nr:hypothetical protein D1AOALGA4SA_754 [Olavius algarvensis Delta 1 endosymbiont]